MNGTLVDGLKLLLTYWWWFVIIIINNSSIIFPMICTSSEYKVKVMAHFSYQYMDHCLFKYQHSLNLRLYVTSSLNLSRTTLFGLDHWTLIDPLPFGDIVNLFKRFNTHAIISQNIVLRILTPSKRPFYPMIGTHQIESSLKYESFY